MPEKDPRAQNSGEGGGGEPPPPVTDEELYTGTKIDSEEEALASEVEALRAGGVLEPSGAGVAGGAYTVGMWRVKPGQEEEFIAAWRALGEIFRGLPQPPVGKGLLVQSVADPALYYSFGPWRSLEDIQAMSQSAQVQAGLEALARHCTEAQPGAYRVVAELEV